MVLWEQSSSQLKQKVGYAMHQNSMPKTGIGFQNTRPLDPYRPRTPLSVTSSCYSPSKSVKKLTPYTKAADFSLPDENPI